MLIQKLRLQRCWSQQQLATLSGLSVRTIQRIEAGQAPGMESLKALAAVFEVDVATLMEEPAMPAHDNPPAAQENAEREAFRYVRKLRCFYQHFAWYLLIVGGITLWNAISSPDHWWAQWVALGWGIGVLAHAATTFHFVPMFGPEWERRQVEKRLGRPL